jgi:NADH-quinone oxidoreductase subunit E
MGSIMLSDEVKKEIDAEARHYPQRRAVVAEALKAVQARRGWVDDESLRDVADYLGLSFDEVDSIATFYNLIFRQPVGRHVILICDSVSCYLTGYEKLLDHLKKKLGIALGQTTADGRFTLLPNACLGLCEQAPAMMIDNETYGHLTAARIDEILGKHE